MTHHIKPEYDAYVERGITPEVERRAWLGIAITPHWHAENTYRFNPGWYAAQKARDAELSDVDRAACILIAAGYTLKAPPPKPELVTLTYIGPKPMTEAPKLGTEYWVWQTGWIEPESMKWDGNNQDKSWLELRVCYARQAQAIVAKEAWEKMWETA